jgi:soluble lytic murein transglycosylase
MFKKKTNTSYLLWRWVIILIALLGTVLFTPQVRHYLEKLIGIDLSFSSPQEFNYNNSNSLVLPLAQLTPQERKAQLQAIATSGEGIEKSRARYVLANDLMDEYQGGLALRFLEGLEEEYPLLTPYILLKRGRAYELTNNNTEATAIWLEIITNYPDSPIEAEALYLLAKSDPQSGNKLQEKHPNHPLTHQLIREKLKENPDQLSLLLFLTQHDPKGADGVTIRDRLVKDYGNQLTPTQWEIVADGYWVTFDYDKAILAYRKAPSNSRNIYRIARGLHLRDKPEEAKRAYQHLVKTYPDAEELQLGLRHLASLSNAKEALPYLDQLMAKFPEDNAQTLFLKANLLESLNNHTSAAQARQMILDDYPTSETASQYRWQMAKKLAEKGDILYAWKWAQPITVNTPNSDLAAEAAFWIGKWATQANRPQDAKIAFEYVLTNHAQSYYGWRSAQMLGWNVGTFTTLKTLNPQIQNPQINIELPAGSELFHELYRLGQQEDSYRLFEGEIENKKELTVNEQFTDAYLKIAQGDYFNGISQIWDLSNRKEPEEIQQWQELRKSPEYWLFLFPFPYEEEVVKWSNQRQLNPLLVIALIRQESRFRADIKSSAGALGLMQVMPDTGKWIAQKINVNNYSLVNPEDNINFGTWYLQHTHEIYKNNSLFAIASYNAGPGNVDEWIKRFPVKQPEEFIEKIPFGETRKYVEIVLGNYWNYLRIYNPEISQKLMEYGNPNFGH